MVITLGFDPSNPSSNPGTTFPFLCVPLFLQLTTTIQGMMSVSITAKLLFREGKDLNNQYGSQCLFNIKTKNSENLSSLSEAYAQWIITLGLVLL